METTFESFYSERARAMKASEIRELLKVTQNPDMISFAGGLPNPDAFPVKLAAEITQDVFKEHGKQALQYGTTEGLPILRETLSKYYQEQGMECTPDQILVTSGAQQGLDLLAKVFLNKGDTVVVGAPTYLGALGAFRAFQANFAQVPLDDKGMRIDELEKTLKNAKREGQRVKFIYVNPTFQNPTGVTLTAERRIRMLELAEEYDTLIVEDEPYERIRYEGDPVEPMYNLERGHGRVIYLGTLSKLFAPGFRMATMIGHPDMMRKFVIAKQSTDLCSTPFTQYIAAEYIRRGHLENHLKNILSMYSKKRDIMLHALEDFMPKGVTWTHPEGGMFVWVTMPEGCNTVDMLSRAIDKKVAYVVGRAFYADGSGENTIRLNFSYPSDEDIREGIKRLADVAKECIASL